MNRVRLVISEVNEKGDVIVHSSFIIENNEVFTEITEEKVGEVDEDGNIHMELKPV